MEFFLPIAEVYVSLPFIFILSLAVGILSGLFGVGGGFLMTPFLIFLGIPPAYAVPNEANNIFEITTDEDFDQTAEAQHGDWVLEAFVSELEQDVYSNTQIICIDVETGANGTYSSGDELSKLLGFDAFFSHEENGFLYYHPDTVDGWEVHPELGVGYIPEIAVPIETILEDMGYLNDDGSADAMVCFSMSISGADAMDYEVPTIEFFDSLVGTHQEILVEKNNFGYTPQYAKVKLEANTIPGQIIKTKILKNNNKYLTGNKIL